MTQADDKILETLEDSGLMLSPHILALNLDYSKAHVSRRLSELQDAGMVAKVNIGVYEITDDGHAYLSGELNVSEIDRD